MGCCFQTDDGLAALDGVERLFARMGGHLNRRSTRSVHITVWHPDGVSCHVKVSVRQQLGSDVLEFTRRTGWFPLGDVFCLFALRARRGDALLFALLLSKANDYMRGSREDATSFWPGELVPGTTSFRRDACFACNRFGACSCDGVS